MLAKLNAQRTHPPFALGSDVRGRGARPGLGLGVVRCGGGRPRTERGDAATVRRLLACLPPPGVGPTPTRERGPGVTYTRAGPRGKH